MNRRILLASFFVLVTGAILMVFGALANGPDRTLTLEQQALTTTPVPELDGALRNVVNWPNWFHSTRLVTVTDGVGRPMPLREQVIQTGTLARIAVTPSLRDAAPILDNPQELVKRGEVTDSDGFELGIQVRKYEPGRLLRISITRDSASKITRLFDRVEWTITLEPTAAGTLLKGEAVAHTCNWRSRLFGALLEHYLVQQIFLPSVAKLAKIKHPFPPNPFPGGLQ